MTRTSRNLDTLVLGAGAAGMMCAAQAAARGGRVLAIDHARAPGEKIRISGGGRCNFTNLHASARNFLSGNRHFAKSALSRYTQHDFIDLVRRHGIGFHEKTMGQLFCDGSSREIIALLTDEMAATGAELQLETTVVGIDRHESGFSLALERAGAPETVACRNLVVACGGKSIPKMGATGRGYQIAARFGHAVTETRPALVPLTFGEDVLATVRPLAGVAAEARVTCNGQTFDEAMLFTHRGLSGPAILQISSYWRETEPIVVTLAPGVDLYATLRERRGRDGKKAVATVLSEVLPKRLAADVVQRSGLGVNLGDLSDARLALLADAVNAWELWPIGSEGYRTAEVTLGGVETGALDQRTMRSRHVPGLYFIGEVVDVTGWLGGYNFQWAWSSGWAAGTAIAAER